MEYSLSIKDIFGILKRDWKRILLIAVICAALLGLLSVVRSSGGSSVTPEEIAENEASIEAYEEWTEAKDVAVEDLSKGLLSAYEYMQNDPYMQIDPYNCTYRQIVVSFGDGGAEASRKRTVQGWVDEGFGEIRDGYPVYLIDVAGDIGEVTVTLYESDAYDLESTAQQIEDYIMKAANDNNITIAAVSNVEWHGKSQVLFERQDQLRNNTLRIQNEITYYSNSTALSEPSHISVPSRGGKGMIKYILFGGFVGLILGIAYAVFCVIRKGILISPVQINEFFAVPELGAYASGNEEKAKLLGAAVSVNAAEKERLFLFNDADPAACEELKDDLNKRTGKEIVTGSGLSADAAEAEKLIDPEGVILPVRFGQTTFKDVQQTIKLSQRFRKDIVGYIVLE